MVLSNIDTPPQGPPVWRRARGAETQAIFPILCYRMGQVSAHRPKSQVPNKDRVHLSPVSQCSSVKEGACPKDCYGSVRDHQESSLILADVSDLATKKKKQRNNKQNPHQLRLALLLSMGVYSQTLTHARVYTQTHTNAYTHAHTEAYRHTHVFAHTQIHTYTHRCQAHSHT